MFIGTDLSDGDSLTEGYQNLSDELESIRDDAILCSFTNYDLNLTLSITQEAILDFQNSYGVYQRFESLDIGRNLSIAKIIVLLDQIATLCNSRLSLDQSISTNLQNFESLCKDNPYKITTTSKKRATKSLYAIEYDISLRSCEPEWREDEMMDEEIACVPDILENWSEVPDVNLISVKKTDLDSVKILPAKSVDLKVTSTKSPDLGPKKACSVVKKQVVTRRNFSPEIRAILNECYRISTFPTLSEKESLRVKTELSSKQIDDWFNNRRKRKRIM